MAFCESCGTQLSDAAKFCRSCGKPLGGGIASASQVPPKPRRPAAKWVLGILAFLVVVVGLGAGVGFYFHRVSKQTEQIPRANSDAGAVANTRQSPSQPAPASLDENKAVTPEQGQCALFSKDELTRVLGTNFTHADADTTGCTYKGDAPREFVRTETLWTGGRALVKLKSDAYAGLHQSMLNQHYTKAEIDGHAFPINPFPGIGDEAWVDLINIVTARRGDVGVTMDLRYYRDSEDLTRTLVNAALARLGGNSPRP